MNQVILLSENELQQKIDIAIENVLWRNSQQKKKEKKIVLDFREGIEYLNSIGYKCSESLIYKLTMKNEIPYSKFGRRISFNAIELDKWIELQKQKSVDIGMTVSMNAHLKTTRS